MEINTEPPDSSEPSAPVKSPVPAGKPRWRRVGEVLIPVVVFAVAVPIMVNGFANAVDNAGSSPATTVIDPAPADEVPPATAPAADIAQEIIGSVINEPSVVATSAPAAPEANAAAGHSHGVATPELPLTRADRIELATQLEAARTTAMKYPTVADAEAGGYRMVTTYLPLIGAHYIKGSAMDGNFKIDEPEMLLYDGTSPDSSIVGLSYYVFSDTEPGQFAGPNDHWHQHIGLCIKNGVVVGGTQLTPEQCAARGGAKADASNGWMIHAWVVPGWDSPQGVFSPEHPGLTADLGKS